MKITIRMLICVLALNCRFLNGLFNNYRSLHLPLIQFSYSKSVVNIAIKTSWAMPNHTLHFVVKLCYACHEILVIKISAPLKLLYPSASSKSIIEIWRVICPIVKEKLLNIFRTRKFYSKQTKVSKQKM